ncbi:MAG TPA: STAS domain-containing protein [Mycobacteriales bacterium]|nr:STAS domain-containing protein [Mycobacteriales bacterium]
MRFMDHAGDPDATRDVAAFFLTTSEHGGVSLLHVDGEVDIATAPTLRAAVAAILEARPGALVIDLSGVPFLDSTGLGVLVAAHKSARALGVPMHLSAARRIVANALRLGQIDTVIPLHDSAEEAVGALGGAPQPDVR